MSNLEKEAIKRTLSNCIEGTEANNAIYIYTDRKVNYAKRLATGIATIQLIKDTMYEGKFFDLNRIVLLPIIELMEYGTDSVLKRHSVNTSFPHICWIPIFYINDKAVMIPVIQERDVPSSLRSEGNFIIINPFSS
ncbi:hypothetical protein SNQ26_001221 [Cronobacter malonaticus]|uniref:hypothetical protein n=1 Tax=Cronobacter malonaticus TaxID=413503 RepID=UPI0024C42862|nr:hypothetical protein [Cronobacter malonaticus]ELY6228063.1 hypothetical protein [Cronobacter malonaticus]MDK1174830.1 hypothetical protein [Cronobacter malonaticus]MDK1686588.1 hypothetical protein [Cronobacter malonaticus]